MTVKTELQLKLKDLRISLGFNQTVFAERLGVSQSAIANMENGTRDVSKHILLKIKDAFNINLLEVPEIKLHKPKACPSNVVPIPFYSVKASAGYGEDLQDYPEQDVIYFDKRWLENVIGVKPEHASIIQAKGDSMDGGNNPIKDGDLLLVDTSSIEPINGQVFVVRLDDSQLYVKRVSKEWDGKWVLLSQNPSYPDIIPSMKAEVIGRVAWNGSKENV